MVDARGGGPARDKAGRRTRIRALAQRPARRTRAREPARRDEDDDVPRIGHSTFVWTEGDEPCGMWDPDRFLSCFFDESCDSDEWLWDDDDARDRDATDRAALVQACTRCEEILRDDFATTLEEDQVMLDEIEEAIRGLSPEEADEDPEGHLEYVAALRYRMSVKRILRDFISECKRAYGVEAEAWKAEPEFEYIRMIPAPRRPRLVYEVVHDNRRNNDHALATRTRSGRARSGCNPTPVSLPTAPPRPPGLVPTSQLCAVPTSRNRLTSQLSSPNAALTAASGSRVSLPSYAALFSGLSASCIVRSGVPRGAATWSRNRYAPPGLSTLLTTSQRALHVVHRAHHQRAHYRVPPRRLPGEATRRTPDALQ